MAMEVAKEYTINDPEDLLECPYDPVHMIRAKRMQYHILKCRQQHPTSETVRCPFNASHEIPSVELRYHMAICEDKHRVISKIAQEHAERDIEMKGCLETPGYKPLGMVGESWEHEIPKDPRVGVQPPPLHFRQPTKSQSVLAPSKEADTEEMSSRQKQLYYLRKKEMEQTAQQQQAQRQGSGDEKLRIPSQPSQSLAIHQQQQRRRQPKDIYEQALKPPEGRVVAFGRGRPMGGGPAPISAGSTQQSIATVGAISMPLGRGAGIRNSKVSHPGSLTSVEGQLVEMNIADAHTQGGHRGASVGTSSIPGRGLPGRGLVRPDVGGGDTGVVPVMGRVRGPQGRGMAMASVVPPAGAIGRGLRSMSGGEQFSPLLEGSIGPPSLSAGQVSGQIPFYQQASQPVGISMLLQQAMPGAAGRGRGGYGAPPSFSSDSSNSYYGADSMPPSSAFSHPLSELGQAGSQEDNDDDDNEQFEDALAWVGGGYSADVQPSPSFSSSVSSLPDGPQVVGSWADEMDQAFPQQDSEESSSVSESSEREFQQSSLGMTATEALKELRKIRKKLRQIDQLEAKQHSGVTLEPATVAKVGAKASLIAKAAKLQKVIDLQQNEQL